MKHYYHLYQFAFPKRPSEYAIIIVVLLVGIFLNQFLLSHQVYKQPDLVSQVQAAPTLTTTASANPTVIVNVQLDATSPAAGAITPGTSGVVFAVLKLATTNGPLVVNSFEVTANSPTANQVTNIKLYDGAGAKIGQTIPALANSVANSGAAISGLSLMLASGSARFITIQADVPVSAQGTVALGLSKITYTSSTSVLIRGLPITGKTMKLTSVPPVPLQPDLVVDSLRLASISRMYAGLPFDADDVTVRIKNQGTATATAFTTQLNLRDAQTDELQCSWADNIPILRPNGVHIVTPNHNSFMNCPPLQAKSYYLQAAVNVSGGANVVVESNNTNNTISTDSFAVLPNSEAPQVGQLNLSKLPQVGLYPKERLSFTVTPSLSYLNPTAMVLYSDNALYQQNPRAYTDKRVAVKQSDNSFYVDITTTQKQLTNYAVVLLHTNVVTPNYTNAPSPVSTSVYLPSNLQQYAGYPFLGDDMRAWIKNQDTIIISNVEVALNVRDVVTNALQCSWTGREQSLAVGEQRNLRPGLSAFLNCPPLSPQAYYLELSVATPGGAVPQTVRTQAFTVKPASEAPQVSAITSQVFSATKAQITFTMSAAPNTALLPGVELFYNDDLTHQYTINERYYTKSRAVTRVSGTPWFRVDLPLLTPSTSNHYAVHIPRTNIVTQDYTP